ncbi:MAG: hypothetical protein IPL35_08985 [Sphingobacteriales bacterium]|nr:hypothetical protein [Sphingobacteriales bacterium]
MKQLHLKRIYFILLYVFFGMDTFHIQAQQTFNWVRTNPGGGGAFNVIEAGSGGTILVGSDLSGVYKSTDNGNSFIPLGEQHGLTMAHIGGIGFDPDNDNIFFVGTVSGLYKTSDGGTTFSKVISTGYISDIWVSETSSNIVYAAWHASYTTTDAQIYKSTDGGTTFSKVSNLPTNANLRIIKFIGDPQNSNTFYFISGKSRNACGVAKLYKTTDGGVSFSDITVANVQVLDADIDPLNTSILYLSTYNGTCDYTNLLGSFYKSTDGGATWNLQSNRTGAIFVKKDNPAIIRRIDPRLTNSWTPEAGTWESTDGGVSWSHTGIIAARTANTTWDTGYLKDVNGVSSGLDVLWGYSIGFEGFIKAMGTDMSNPDVILWADTQYAFRSDDGGVSFNNLFTKKLANNNWQSTGLDNINIVDVEINKGDNNIIYAGYFDIGFWRSLDGGISWQSGNAADYTGGWNGYGGNVASIVSDPQRTNVVWTTMSEHQMGESPTYLLRSNNFGEKSSWILSNSGLPTQEVMGLSLDENSLSSNRTLYVTAQGKVYKSSNDGTSWQLLNSGLPANGMRFTAVDKFNGNIVYAGGGNGLYASLDAGTTWSAIGNTEINTGGSVSFWPQTNGQGVFDIVPDPLTTGVVYVTVYGNNKGLYRGTLSGSTWTWEKLYTDNFMRKVAINPSNPQQIAATSSSAFTDGWYHPASKGIIYSTDGFATSSIVDELEWPFGMTADMTATEIFIGSPGTGIHKAALALSPPCPTNRCFKITATKSN